MSREEDETDEGSMGATRYPCMPSLVALQQMRNRLHLAYLGRKLMKWTGLATGRELRRIAAEIDKVYKSFTEDVAKAYLLLARARYFNPTLNQMVIEDVQWGAGVTVVSSYKTVAAGVKVLHYNVVESQEPYMHLGIEKGGQTIHEAKEAWLALIKRMVYMQQLRMCFEMVDAAHKSANKKRNVLAKAIIPRILASIRYILTELEEQEREEMFRLKRVKEKKMKAKSNKKMHICCCCLAMMKADEEAAEAEYLFKQDTKAKIEQTVILAPCKSSDNKGKLEDLMSHIDDVIQLTEQCKTEGVLSPSMENFITTFKGVKNKLEDYTNAPPLCDICRKNMADNVEKLQKKTETGTCKTAALPPCLSNHLTDIPKEPPTASIYKLGPESEFGYFEKKFKEIVKVTRLQNEDGTVSEEKQVITIKTERRNPRKPNNFDECPFSDTLCGGGGGGGRGASGGGFAGNGKMFKDSGGDGGPDSRHFKPRQAKSEHSNRSQPMGELKLRSCISADNTTKEMTRTDAATCCSSNLSSKKPSKVSLPPETNNKQTCCSKQKVTKSSSIDSSICCPMKTGSVYGEELTSLVSESKCKSNCEPLGKPSKTRTNNITTSVSKDDKSTCCLSICGEEPLKQPYLKSSDKLKEISTDALWRDAYTSTTELDILPSQLSQSYKTTSAPNCSIKLEPNIEVGRKNETSSSCCAMNIKPKPDTELKKDTIRSCCTIKIKPKSPKLNVDELAKNKKQKGGGNEIVLKGSLLDAIRRVYLPPSREFCKPAHSEKEIKSVCADCFSKISNIASQKLPESPTKSSTCNVCQTKTESESFQPKHSSFPSSSQASSVCKLCQTKSEVEIKSSVCPSNEMFSYTPSGTSCRSVGVGSNTSCIRPPVTSPSCPALKKPSVCQSCHRAKPVCPSCGKATPKPSTCSACEKKSSGHSEKHRCCLSAPLDSDDDGEDEVTCCSQAQSAQSSKSCCSQAKPSSVCPKKKVSASTEVETKEAATETKRASRFDVRPAKVRHPTKKPMDCTCRSDTYLMKNNRSRNPVQRCRSEPITEEDYFFRW